jgi:molecular chaperone DnaK (HSP70)
MTKSPPQPQPRFIIGIDLGTTNSVVAFVDSSREDGSVEVLRIPQLTAPGTVEGRELLPSFLYIPA